MGAVDISASFEGHLSSEEVQERFSELVKEAERYYGENPYNGSWNTISSVRGPGGHVFDNEEEAFEYCIEKAEKWEYARAVHYWGENREPRTIIAGLAAT